MAFLVAALRSPQVPSQSLPLPLDKVTKGHAATESECCHGSVLMSGRQALAMRSEWRCSPLATITLLGEQQDITDPEPALLLPGRRPVGHAHRVTRRAVS
jgi:hypothetical protein